MVFEEGCEFFVLFGAFVGVGFGECRQHNIKKYLLSAKKCFFDQMLLVGLLERVNLFFLNYYQIYNRQFEWASKTRRVLLLVSRLSSSSQFCSLRPLLLLSLCCWGSGGTRDMWVLLLQLFLPVLLLTFHRSIPISIRLTRLFLLRVVRVLQVLFYRQQ